MKRKMRNLLLVLAALAAAALAGCGANKDSEVNAFVTDVDKLTSDIVARVKSDPTAAGLDAAQAILDKRKAELKARYDQLKGLRGYELSDAVMKKFTDSVSKNMESVADLQLQFAEQTVGDAAFGAKMSRLYADYNSIYGV